MWSKQAKSNAIVTTSSVQSAKGNYGSCACVNVMIGHVCELKARIGQVLMAEGH